MDHKQPSEPAKCISEYAEARERFEKYSNNESQDESVTCLDELFSKICTGQFHLEAGTDASQFYDLIYHLDFLQIKNEFLEVVYTELCRVYFFSDLFGDILEDSEQLDYIPHVKIYLVQALLKLLHVVLKYEDDYLVLKYSSPHKTWYNISSYKVTHLKIHPSAYKLMLSNVKFSFRHLNFICRHLEVQNLRLDGCRLNLGDICNLFKDLNLKSLGLSKCGRSVNVIFQERLLDFKNLSDLDISENVLFNSTLEIIRNIPLKNLKINNIRIRAHDSIRFHENHSLCTYNFDLLWEDGILRETIESLNIINNKGCGSLGNISKLKLKELYMNNFPTMFPNTLRSLTLENCYLNFNEFVELTSLPLEELNIRYKGSNEDFSALIGTTITKTLKKLSIHLGAPCDTFVLFIANFELVYFKCDGKIENRSFDRFINQYTLQRTFLKSLFMNGGSLRLTRALLDGISKLKLVQLGIGLTTPVMEYTWEYRDALALESLHESLETLWILDKNCKIDELEQIAKFKKVKELAFSFTVGGSVLPPLQKISNISVECFKVQATVNSLLDLGGAKSLCALPIQELQVIDNYHEPISEEAFEYLSNSQNSINFGKNAVSLTISGSLKPNMAQILGCVNWETVTFYHCEAGKRSLKLFFQNRNLIRTLQSLVIYDPVVDGEDIRKFRVSRVLNTQKFDRKTLVEGLECKLIAKFLKHVFLEDRNTGKE